MGKGRKELGALKKQRAAILERYKKRKLSAKDTVCKLNEIDRQIRKLQDD